MTEIKDLLGLVVSWQLLAGAVLIFSLLPGVILRLALLAYPKGHDRRRELIAELKYVRRWERPFWVAEQLDGILAEGLPARAAARRQPRAQPRGIVVLHSIAVADEDELTQLVAQIHGSGGITDMRVSGHGRNVNITYHSLDRVMVQRIFVSTPAADETKP